MEKKEEEEALILPLPPSSQSSSSEKFGSIYNDAQSYWYVCKNICFEIQDFGRGHLVCGQVIKCCDSHCCPSMAWHINHL